MQTEQLVQSVKAAVLATIISVIFAMLLAVVVQLFPVGKTAQLITAQTLKGISLMIGSMLALKTEGGWKKGMIAGVLFTLLTYLSFSAIGGDFSSSWKVLLDLLFGVAVGVLSGIAAVNLKRS